MVSKPDIHIKWFEKTLIALCTLICTACLAVGGWSLNSSMDANVKLAEIRIEQAHLEKDVDSVNIKVTINSSEIGNIKQKNSILNERIKNIDANIADIKVDLRDLKEVLSK